MIYLVNKTSLHIDSIYHTNYQLTVDQNNVFKNTGHQLHFHVIILQI